MSWKVPKSWQSASGEPAFCSSPGDPYPRLTALQRHIEAGTLLVDIGTDHARLPIAALQSDRCTAAIGIDIHADPLAGARLRALAAGVGSRLILHQDDALTNLCIRVPCTIVGAGIGGNLIASSVEEWLRRAPELKALVLNPMSEERMMRAALYRAGLRCQHQTLVLDSGRIFLVERWLPGSLAGSPSFQPADEDIILGERLKAGHDPLWQPWLHTQHDWLQRSLRAMPPGERREQTSGHLAVVKQAISGT